MCCMYTSLHGVIFVCAAFDGHQGTDNNDVLSFASACATDKVHGLL